MKAKKTSGKGPAEGPPAGSDGNPHKRLESERIASDIADYEKSGGKVEKLGVTRVLQTVAPAQKGGVSNPRRRYGRARVSVRDDRHAPAWQPGSGRYRIRVLRLPIPERPVLLRHFHQVDEHVLLRRASRACRPSATAR